MSDRDRAERLAGDVAVVTGAGRGIGRAIAEALGAAGASVVAADLDGAAARAVGDAVAGIGCACDVSDAADVRRLAEHVLAELGPASILVCNAGIASSCALLHLSVEEWDRTLAVNARGTFLCTQAFAAQMVQRGGGCVVNVSSVSGRVGDPLLAHYSASKAAILGFTQSAARELAQHGIRVNAVCPGTVDTEMGRELAADWNLSLEGLARRDQLIPRPIAPPEVAAAVVFLVGASAITGQALNVDGGLLFN